MAMHSNGVHAMTSEMLLGAGLGLLVLGGGGRAVMRGIALLTDAPDTMSIGGTTTVLAAGTAAGAAGARARAA